MLAGGEGKGVKLSILRERNSGVRVRPCLKRLGGKTMAKAMEAPPKPREVLFIT